MGSSIKSHKIKRQIVDTKAHSPKGKRFQNEKATFVHLNKEVNEDKFVFTFTIFTDQQNEYKNQ